MLQVDKSVVYFTEMFFEIPLYLSTYRQYHKVDAFPQLVNLSNNCLTGSIPLDIASRCSTCTAITSQVQYHLHWDGLHFLSELNVSNNDLEGPIPTGGQFGTFSESSFDGNPKVCAAPPLIMIVVQTKCIQPPFPPEKEAVNNTAFVIAFSAFFGVGVIYDQMVLSRFFWLVLPQCSYGFRDYLSSNLACYSGLAKSPVNKAVSTYQQN